MASLKLISLTKRQRFILASIATFGLSWFFPTIWQYGPLGLIGIIIVLYAIMYYALWENITGIEYLTLFILPITFIVGSNLFISILPERKIFRYPLYALIPIGTYIILLTENIFNVAAIRTIQLLRAAHAVSYIATLLTAYFLLSYIVSLHADIVYSSILITLTISPLTLQFLWSFDLISAFSRRTSLYIAVISIVFIQINILMHFYPQSVAMTSLFLVAVYYVLLGILQHFYEKKLTRKPIVEYAIVACIVFIIMIITTAWQG